MRTYVEQGLFHVQKKFATDTRVIRKFNFTLQIVIESREKASFSS